MLRVGIYHPSSNGRSVLLLLILPHHKVLLLLLHVVLITLVLLLQSHLRRKVVGQIHLIKGHRISVKSCIWLLVTTILILGCLDCMFITCS